MSKQTLRELDKVRLQPEVPDETANHDGDDSDDVVHVNSDSEPESEVTDVDDDEVEYEIDFIKCAEYKDTRFTDPNGFLGWHYGVMWSGYLKSESDTFEPRSNFLKDNEKVSRTLLEDEPGGKIGEKVWPSRAYIKEKINNTKPRRDYQAFWRRKEKLEAGEPITKADSDYYIYKKRRERKRAERAAEKAAQAASGVSAAAGPSRPRDKTSVEAGPSRQRDRSKSDEPKRKRDASQDVVPMSRKGKERMPPPKDTTPLKAKDKGKSRSRDPTPSQPSRPSPTPSFNSLFDEPLGGSQASQTSVKERTPKRRRVVDSPPGSPTQTKEDRKAAQSKMLSGMGKITKKPVGADDRDSVSKHSTNGTRGAAFEPDPSIFGEGVATLDLRGNVEHARGTPLFDFGEGHHDDNDDAMSVDARKEPTPLQPEPSVTHNAPEVINLADSPDAPHSEDEVGEILEPGSPPDTALAPPAPPALTVTSATPVKHADSQQGPASSPSRPPATTEAAAGPSSAPLGAANGSLPAKPSDETIATAESATGAATPSAAAQQMSATSQPKPSEAPQPKPEEAHSTVRPSLKDKPKYKQTKRIVTIDAPVDPTRGSLPPGKLGANLPFRLQPTQPGPGRPPLNRNAATGPSPVSRTGPQTRPWGNPATNGGDRSAGPSRGGRHGPGGRSPVTRGGMSPNYGTRSPLQGGVSPYNGNVSPRAPTGALSPQATHGSMSPVWNGPGAPAPAPPAPVPSGIYEARRDPRRRGPGTAVPAPPPPAVPPPSSSAPTADRTLCRLTVYTMVDMEGQAITLRSGVTSRPDGTFLLQTPPMPKLLFQSVDQLCLGMLCSQGATVTEWARVQADPKGMWLNMMNEMTSANRIFVCADEMRPPQEPLTSHRLIVLALPEHAFLDSIGVDGRDKARLGCVAIIVDVPFDGKRLASLPNPVRPEFRVDDKRDEQRDAQAATMVPAKRTVVSYGFNADTVAQNSTIFIMPSVYNKCKIYDEMVQMCKENDIEAPRDGVPPDSVFVLNGRFTDVARSNTVRRCLDSQTRFMALGHDLSTPVHQWSLRPVWETGGLVTFSPTFILRNFEQMTDIINIIRTTRNWATYVVPSTMLYFDAHWQASPEPSGTYAALTSALFMDDNLLKLAGSLASEEGGMAVSYVPPPMQRREAVAEWVNWLARVFECTEYEALIELCRAAPSNQAKNPSLAEVEMAGVSDLLSMRCRPHIVPYRRFIYIGGVSRPDIKRDAMQRGVEIVSPDDFEAVLQGAV